MTNEEFRNQDLENNMGRGKIMTINSHGERKLMDIDVYNQSEMSDYKYDLDWDLSHGFTEANQAFDEIEGSYGSNNFAKESDIEVMKGWSKEMWIIFRMQNTVSEEEVFGPILRLIEEGED